MISERMFEWTMNVDKPCKFMSSEAHVKERLDTTFTNVCYFGSLILDVTKVNKVSMCRIITSNHLGHGSLNVCFTARVLNYRKGDIIPDVQIQIVQGQLSGISKYATVTIDKSPNNKVLVSGQTVPIMVGDKIRYNTNSNTINILGEILTPVTSAATYHIQGKIDSKVYNSLNNLITTIRDQEKELKGEKNKEFTDLLSAKSAGRKSGSAPVDGSVDIITFLEKAKDKNVDVDGYWKKDLSRSSVSLQFDVRDKPKNEEYISLTPMLALSEMLYQCYALRAGVIGLTDYYDKEKMEQASNIWVMMKKNKLIA